MIFFGKLQAIQSDISEIKKLQAAEAIVRKYYNLFSVSHSPQKGFGKVSRKRAL